MDPHAFANAGIGEKTEALVYAGDFARQLRR